MIFSKIVGWGDYLPDKVLTNDNLSETIETSDEWIFPRTGIKQRHIALKKELTSDLAINAAKEAFENSTISPSDIDWFIPHQANQRIISSTAKKLGISEDKTISTVKFHANTSAASIPLALSSAIKDGKIKENHLIAMCAIGGGLTWGSCILKF